MPLSPDLSTDAASSHPPIPVLDVVVPVHDEEADLEPCLRRLRDHLDTLPSSSRITIAENASTDGTADLARRLAAELPEVRRAGVTEPGRGRALSRAWLASDAAVLVYMDVDLSTDLTALLPLVAPLISGHSDLAIGTRLAGSSRVVRGAKREFISRSYNLLLRGTLATHFSDAQCGFKAIRADVAAPAAAAGGGHRLVLRHRAAGPRRAGRAAHRTRCRSTGSTTPTAGSTSSPPPSPTWPASSGCGGPSPPAGCRWPTCAPRSAAARSSSPPGGVPAGLAGQLVRFAAIGAATTLAYLALFVVLRHGLEPQAANLVALLRHRGGQHRGQPPAHLRRTRRGGALRAQGQSLMVFGLGLTLTSGSLGVLHATVAAPSTALELTVLVAANAAATVLRFLLLRHWVFRARPTTPVPAVHPELESTR